MDVEAWLREWLFHGWSLTVLKLQPYQMEEHQATIANHLDAVRRSLAGFADYDFAALCKDVSAVALLFRLSPERADVSATDIRQALAIAKYSARLSRLESL